MNFFGHSTLALALDDDPRVLLGSMLPDFQGMARLRLDGVDDERVAFGIDHHHVVDEAFHGAPLFLRLMHDAQDELERAGVPWGPAMAVAHVGTELFLDGWIAHVIGEHPGYRAALRIEGHGLRFHDGADRFQVLRERLAGSPLPIAYRDPGFVAERLVFILKQRPRLALDDAGRQAVAAWAPTGRDHVERWAAELLDEVRGRLDGVTGEGQ